MAFHVSSAVLLVILVLTLAISIQNVTCSDQVCEAGEGTTTTCPTATGSSKRDTAGKIQPIKTKQHQFDPKKPLRPSDLPGPQVFDQWDENTTISITDFLNGKDIGTISIATGSILQQGTTDEFYSNFSVLESAVPREDVSTILKLLHGQGKERGKETAVELDSDPDSVDGMSSQEMFLDNDGLRHGKVSKEYFDMAYDHSEGKAKLRQQIQNITNPILDNIITPYVRSRYPNICTKPGRECTPCYSLIRRYRSKERLSHAPHQDKHSLVSVVVSLSDYGTEYTGGLYVAAKNSERYHVALNRGDAVVHQSDLYHGVQVFEDNEINTERWSWVLWYRDSNTCEDHSAEWFKDCAHNGNPTCQYLYGTVIQTNDEAVYWNTEAANNGHGAASVKMARAYLKTLPSSLDMDINKAKTFFENAVENSNEPDAHYGLALMKLVFLSSDLMRQGVAGVEPNHPMLLEVISHLESAAMGRHAFAMFNLGIVHCYGYGTNERNYDLAVEWFIASGLPEGFAATALYLQQIGNVDAFNDYKDRAEVLGFNSNYRVEARKMTGSGGAAGVDLNLHWPPILPERLKPPQW